MEIPLGSKGLYFIFEIFPMKFCFYHRLKVDIFDDQSKEDLLVNQFSIIWHKQLHSYLINYLIYPIIFKFLHHFYIFY
jgi:hypothetical protein